MLTVDGRRGGRTNFTNPERAELPDRLAARIKDYDDVDPGQRESLNSPGMRSQ
jgi:hypothetical protein